MSITIKDGGAYKTATKINVKVDGSYSPVSKVKYAQSGGPVDEKIEVSYRGPLAGN